MKNLDIRVRILAMLMLAIGILLFETEYAVYMSLAFACIWTGAILGKRRLVSHLVIFAALEIGLLLIRDLKAVGNLPLLLVYMRRLVIAVITAFPIVKAPTGKLIASLDKLKVPRAATISLAVLFRFLPTVSMEYKEIRRAQKYRNIGVSFKTVVCRIPQLFECTIVPLLIRTTKIADELTASAEVRGMKLEGDYNPYYEVKMHVTDWLALLATLLCTAAIFCMDFFVRGWK